jgi:hypothetical protein
LGRTKPARTPKCTPNLVGASDFASFTPMGSLTHSERNAAPVRWATTCHSVGTVHEIYVQYLCMVSPLSQSRLSGSIVTVSATSGIFLQCAHPLTLCIMWAGSIFYIFSTRHASTHSHKICEMPTRKNIHFTRTYTLTFRTPLSAQATCLSTQMFCCASMPT